MPIAGPGHVSSALQVRPSEPEHVSGRIPPGAGAVEETSTDQDQQMFTSHPPSPVKSKYDLGCLACPLASSKGSGPAPPTAPEPPCSAWGSVIARPEARTMWPDEGSSASQMSILGLLHRRCKKIQSQQQGPRRAGHPETVYEGEQDAG